MPWCGAGATSEFWWVWPLVGFAFLAVMMFVCFRGMECAPWGRRRSGELADLQREVQGLKDDVRKLLGQAS
jgi:hypothetical protein